MEKTRQNKNKDIPLKRKLTLGLLAIVLALTACRSVNSATTEVISTPTPNAETYPYSRQFSTLQLAYIGVTPDGIAERVLLGFEDMDITFVGNSVISNFSPPSYLSERPCEADPLFVEAAEKNSQPFSIEDLRETVCENIESVARQIEMPEEQIPGFVNMMAQKTIVIKNEDIEQICMKNAGACVNHGNVFLSLNSINSFPHEAVHFFENKVPDGAFYLAEKNVCMIKKDGIVSFVYVDGTTNTNWQYFLSLELLSVLSDIQKSPMGTSSYTPDPNAEVTIKLQNIAQNIDSILKALIPHGTFQPTLADLASILSQIIENNGIPELIEANNLLARELDRVFERTSVGGINESYLSPVNTCQEQ
ncbi:MAG: hypothetical protein US40_C0015G0020 [Candidatus Roizmanbacteria bacterium GW2011_GWC2_37_13]|uniref:Uncharacterized protein n=1 Tax=Candidatus Roizmanbacteria bacterium GW2011_GWC2_37_13 TaxID=1618486 RepID=A0A0G0IK76_9BACT|nr:MAG: hypothetical protein US38_C0015G0008 [Candidatus Roizmanbacteria bacterium GW2011_GWC1_37_12]KKQ24589.1 MAG: hypothetical protein US40_C0015G0020 [Candidatus Roizmanbacteria bacterium GW2011_GWC2_37_13]